MKKTLIALLALSGIAMAETYTNLLDSQSNWTTINGSANWNTAGEVHVNGWNKGVFQYTLDPSFELTHGGTITFSYGLHITHNVLLTVSLLSDDQALVTGWGGYDTYHQVAVGLTSTVTPGSYNFKDQGGVNVLTPISAVVETSDNNRSYDNTVNGVIKWNEETEKYECSLSTATAAAQTVSLGSTFNLKSIVLSVEGNAAGSPNSAIMGLSLTTNNVPEPATSSLSLLALAGLCARRRKK